MSVNEGQISLSLKEHNIGFYLPPGARQEGRMILPWGALICGEFIGDLLCESGSVILPAGARLRGRVEADRIYVVGEVSSNKERSLLIGRMLVAAAGSAKINADMFSATYALHKPKIWGTMGSIEDAETLRLRRTAHARGAGAASPEAVDRRRQP